MRKTKDSLKKVLFKTVISAATLFILSSKGSKLLKGITLEIYNSKSSEK